MSLELQLKDLGKKAFDSMPADVAKKIKDGIELTIKGDFKANALKVGDSVPSFVLKDIFENKKNVKDLIKNDYLVIDFYRGGWCPFCNMELREYQRLVNDFEKIGASIVAISPEKAEFTEVTSKENILSFDVLSDVDSKVMSEFGIVFTLDEDVKEVYGHFGIKLEETQGNSDFKMPIPATYVINKNLEVVFAHIEEDYTTRCEPKDVLDFLIKNRA